MKGRNISEFIRPHIEFVLARDNIPYEIRNHKIYVDLSSRGFKEVMNDALCEVQRSNSRIPVYTFKTVVDTKKRERLKEFYGTNNFRTFHKDADKFAACF